MLADRNETVILCILEVVGVLTALYGLWFIYVHKVTALGIFFCSVWYVLGALSHGLGIAAIFFESEEDELKGDSQSLLQFHYMSGWLSVIVGYPLLVTYTWLVLYPTWIAYLHIGLSVIPVIAFLAQSNYAIMRTTQLCPGIAILSHAYITFMIGDMMGLASAGVMMITILALSTPTKYHVWAFNSRELFIIGLVVTSVLILYSIVNLGTPIQKLRLGLKK